jgi:hypothetical protein
LRAIHRNVSPCPHGNAHICSRQGWCIVDTVTGHGDLPAVLLKVCDQTLLVLRFHFTVDFFNPHLPGDSPSGGEPVASSHDDFDVISLELGDCFFGGRINRI